MDAQKVDMFLMANNHYLPQSKLLPLREQLLSLDDSYWIVLTTIQFKNPTMAVLLSIFFFHLAADRFYIGDIALGLLKLFNRWSNKRSQLPKASSSPSINSYIYYQP